MAVKVKTLDEYKHAGSEVTHETATSISTSNGVLVVNRGSGVSAVTVAIYQDGFWMSAVVEKTD